MQRHYTTICLKDNKSNKRFKTTTTMLMRTQPYQCCIRTSRHANRDISFCRHQILNLIHSNKLYVFLFYKQKNYKKKT